MPDTSAHLPPRTVLVEKYMLGRVLGQGGFGITYLAWDLTLSRKLAIKEYYPREICSRGRDAITLQPISMRSSKDFEYGLAKFKEEGQNLARFRDYPGIVSLLEYFESNGTAYIVMAYMEGMTFKQYLEQQPGSKIDFEGALAILTPVMDALREVHRVGMLHRDISPDNIYLNQDRQVKILDFGATRYAMREQSHGLTVLFKPGYAPFEQYSSGGKQGTWTDVYAVGATFYRALTGKPPSEAPDRMAKDDLILPSAMGIRIPIESEPALFKALAVKWENRFEHMEDFQEALTPRIIVPPPPFKLSPWMIAACVLLITTLSFAGLWLAARERLSQAAASGHQDDTQLRAELRHTRAELDSLTQGDQASKNNLSQTAKTLAAAMVERDTLSKNLATAQGQINDLARQLEQAKHRPPPSANAAHASSPAISVAYLQLFEWDRLTNARKGPASVFPAASTRRILCAVGGPNPTQGSEPFSGQIAIAFIAPSGAMKTRVGLGVHTNPGQATWAAMAYWGNDQAGTIEKGRWRIEVSAGAQMLKVDNFTVD